MALNLHFVMLAAVCSGQALTVTSPTCASPAVFVPSMLVGIHRSHSNHTQFALNGHDYLVTVDHYSDFYEIDQLPTIQSSAVI